MSQAQRPPRLATCRNSLRLVVIWGRKRAGRGREEGVSGVVGGRGAGDGVADVCKSCCNWGKEHLFDFGAGVHDCDALQRRGGERERGDSASEAEIVARVT